MYHTQRAILVFGSYPDIVEHLSENVVDTLHKKIFSVKIDISRYSHAEDTPQA